MSELTWTEILIILGTFAAAIIVGVLVSHTVSAISCRIARRGAADDAAIARRMRVSARLKGPIAVILAVGAWQLALAFIVLPLDARMTMHDVGRVVLVLGLVWLTLRVADLGIDVLSTRTHLFARHQLSRSLLPLGRRIVKILILAVAIVALLGSLGYSVTGLVAGLGITGIAVALAAQKTLENVVGAFALGIDQPLREGDFVKVDQTIGTVERIGLRSTRVRTLDRTLVAFPNGKLADSIIESLSSRDRGRFDAKFRLALGTTGAQLREIRDRVEQMLTSHPQRASDVPSVHLTGPGDTWFVLEVMAWFTVDEWSKFESLRDQLLLDCLDVIAEAGAVLNGAPVPTPEAGPARAADGDREKPSKPSERKPVH